MSFDGNTHVFGVRVYYEDTDAAGIVYYANYLRYAERGRTEMLRELGLESSMLRREQGIALAVRRCEVDYLRPARLDDELHVRTRIEAVGGASTDLDQTIVGDDGAPRVAMSLKLACMDDDGRPARLPDGLRRALQERVANR